MRPFKSGQHSHNVAIENALKILDYDKQLRIRMTFDPSIVGNLYENVMYLINNGFKTIVPAANLFDKKWSYDDIKILETQLKKIKYELGVNQGIRVGIISSDTYVKKGPCNGGLTSYHISPNGEIYPCVLTVGDNAFVMGNVYTGIDLIKRDFFLSLSMKKNQVCDGCKLYDYCDGARCKLINKILTRDYFKPCGTQCAIENVRYTILRNEMIRSKPTCC